MSFDLQLLIHRTYPSPAIHFVLNEDLTKDCFFELTELLGNNAKTKATRDSLDRYWESLVRRAAGNWQWDKIIPYIPIDSKAQGSESERRIEKQTLAKMIEFRDYHSFTIGDIELVIDLFNPKGELEIPYSGCNRPVLTWVLKELEFGAVQYRLAEHPLFYTLLKQAISILKPITVCGIAPSPLVSWMKAFMENRVDKTMSYWDFLADLHIMKKPDQIDLSSVLELFKKVEEWPEGWILFQVRDGIDSVLSKDYVRAAKALGMKSIKEVNPDF